MNKQANKPGYKTTEFWTVILTYAFGFFVAKGILDAEKAQQLASGVAEVVVALIPFIAALVNVMYINSRTSVKMTETMYPEGKTEEPTATDETDPQ